MPSKASPTISAIIVTYNRRPQLARAIDSILAQEPPPCEIIIVDDGSTDGTVEYLRERFGDAIKVLARPHAGVSVARRHGVLAATGDWIAFLDSDDAWAEGRLDVLLKAALAAPAETRWIFGDSEFIYNDRTSRVFADNGWTCDQAVTVIYEPASTQFPYMLSLLPSSLVRRDALIEAGCFNENLETSEDLLVSFRIALMGPFACVPNVVTLVDRTGREDSLAQRCERSPDYFRARVLAFDDFARTLGRNRWGPHYARAVRGWCIALARRGQACRAEALLQFKHAATTKEVLFLLLALSGTAAVKLWGATGQRIARNALQTRPHMPIAARSGAGA